MTPDPKTRRHRWIIFWVLAFGYILVYFHRLCPAVVAVDMMKDLRTGGGLTGFLSAAYFYSYAAMQLPAGLLSDSWGPRNTITVFFLVAFVGSVLLGFASSVVMAIAGRLLVGVGVAMLFVPTLKILSEWFTPVEFAPMSGILMAMGGIGSLSAATPLVLLSGAIGWRMSFVAVGGLTLVLSLLVWIFVRDCPEDMGCVSPNASSKASSPAIGLMAGFRTVVSCPHFWPLAIWFFFDCAVFFTFGGLWGGPYFMQVYHLSKSQAGYILSMLAVGIVIGGPLHGFLSNRVFHARKPVLLISTFILVAITATLSFAADRIPVFGLYLICLGLGMFASAVVVIGFTATKELFPVRIAGTATGLVNLFPFAGGAIFQPFTGYLLERSGSVDGAFTLAGYQQMFNSLLISACIAMLACCFIRETFPSTSARSVAP
ncbi:MAG: MFS transporter [Deltaproteobacteria bacterium]|nr:MFS transporter [Deltaproteobacteria bacterium]